MKRALPLILLFLCSSAIAKPEIEAKGRAYEAKIGRSSGDAVLIGEGSKSGSFKKRVKFTRWNGENSLEIEAPNGIINDDTPETVGGELLIKDSEKGMYFKTFDQDTFKFGLIFYSKPSTNTFDFVINGWEQFDFFYQPPLANENADGSTWENTPWGGKRNRPADVNCSYAVYHKTKRNHVLGETNYGTGKFCHIYRPRFIDANGDTVWGDIHIENGVYTVSAPQSFLDKATYPVKANDTVGYTSIGGSDDSGNIGLFYSWESTANAASSGTLTSMTMAYWLASGTGHSKYALYSNAAGSPNTPNALITNSGTAEFTITRTTKPTSDLATWTTANTGAASIASATQYWLATNNDNGSINNAYDTGAADEVRVYLLPYGSFPPGTAATDFGASLRLSFYFTYTPAGGAKTLAALGAG